MALQNKEFFICTAPSKICFVMVAGEVKNVCVSIELYCADVPGALKATKGNPGRISKLNVGCEFCRQEYK